MSIHMYIHVYIHMSGSARKTRVVGIEDAPELPWSDECVSVELDDPIIPAPDIIDVRSLS